MLRDEKIDSVTPIQRNGGSADVRDVGRGRVTHYFSLPSRPLWNECVRCHRMDTLVETSVTGNDEKAWKCRKCGEVSSRSEIDGYIGDVMLNDMNTSECPPVMTTAMSRCAEILFRHSKGEHVSRAETGNAAGLETRIEY